VADLRLGENSQLHKWKVSSTGELTYVAESHEYASDNVRQKPPGGMPGGFCSGSSKSNSCQQVQPAVDLYRLAQ
jgi:hypothetical protein